MYNTGFGCYMVAAAVGLASYHPHYSPVFSQSFPIPIPSHTIVTQKWHRVVLDFNIHYTLCRTIVPYYIDLCTKYLLFASIAALRGAGKKTRKNISPIL